MKFRYISVIIVFIQLTSLYANDKPFRYVNLGFGALRMENKWIKSYSVGIGHDFKIIKRQTISFGCYIEHHRINTTYDVDTTFIPTGGANLDDTRRYYNFNFKATSIHFSLNYKYWLNTSDNSKYYLEGGIISNIIINQNAKYEYYYRGWPNQTLYLGPYYVNEDYKPNTDDIISNVFRPVIGFGFLEKISTKNFLTFQLYISHSLNFQTIKKTANLYPRFSVGLAF